MVKNCMVLLSLNDKNKFGSPNLAILFLLDVFPRVLLLMMMCDTDWHLCPHSLCGCIRLFLLRRIPWRTEYLLKGSDICLMPLISLAKMMCSDTRQDLTEPELFQHQVCH